jgi:hypothetical protein
MYVSIVLEGCTYQSFYLFYSLHSAHRITMSHRKDSKDHIFTKNVCLTSYKMFYISFYLLYSLHSEQGIKMLTKKIVKSTIFNKNVCFYSFQFWKVISKLSPAKSFLGTWKKSLFQAFLLAFYNILATLFSTTC